MTREGDATARVVDDEAAAAAAPPPSRRYVVVNGLRYVVPYLHQFVVKVADKRGTYARGPYAPTSCEYK